MNVLSILILPVLLIQCCDATNFQQPKPISPRQQARRSLPIARPDFIEDIAQTVRNALEDPLGQEITSTSLLAERNSASETL